MLIFHLYIFFDKVQSLTQWAWWFLPIIPALGRQKQEDWKFDGGLGYIVSSSPVCANALSQKTKPSKQNMKKIF
jgi:hypothetical protein